MNGLQFIEPALALWALVLVPVLLVQRRTLVDRPARLRLAAFAARIVAIVLLAAALARPTWPTERERLHVAFLVDLSASVDLDSVTAALDRVDESISTLAPRDTWTLTGVADELRAYDDTDALRAEVDAWREGAVDDRFRSASRLADALRSTRLSLPGDAASRVVLLTDARPVDGPATAGDADRDLARAIADVRGERDDSDGAAAVDLRIERLDGLAHPEVSVASLRATPDAAREGEVVRLTARVAANRPGPVEVRLVHEGVVITRRTVEPRIDEPLDVIFDMPMPTAGRSIWSVEASAEADHFLVNNRAETAIEVAGRPRVLAIHTSPRDMRDFERAMAKQDVAVETRPPGGCPRTLQELLTFDAVLLADVAATDLEPSQLELLRDFVLDFGGGLAMLGSERSFGLGGYHATAVEEVLPLVSRFEKEKEKPSLAMVLVIDKSGSMEGAPIALARQAAKATVELLSARDQIGVVGFDGRAFVAAPMQSAIAGGDVDSQIDRLAAGGGTFMYAGMVEARDMLFNTSAKLKHMVILGDGQTQPADHDGVVAELVDMGVTVSTVALGGGADQALLARIAERGRGRAYVTMDPASVPQIFTRETMEASKSAIKEDLVAGIPVGDHPMLTGFTDTELPFSLGYVMTRARPTSQVLLATDTGDPLLAVGTFGLGTGMCFTSDLTPRWGAEWLAWPGFGQFWGQAMRSLVRRPNTGDASVLADVGEDRWDLEVTRPPSTLAAAARSGDTAVLARPEPWIAEYLDDAGRRTPLDVEPVGLGRARVDAELGVGRRATIRLIDPETRELRVLHHTRSASREYALGGTPAPALDGTAAFEPAAIRADVTPTAIRRDLAPWLLLLACGAFIAGIFLRRI